MSKAEENSFAKNVKISFSDIFFFGGGAGFLPLVSEKCWPGLGDGGGPVPCSPSLLPAFG